MRKKLLFVAAGLGAGGAERQITTVACLLKKEGYDVTIYCWNDENFFDEQIIAAGIQLVRRVAGGAKRLFGVRKFIREGKYDAVISFLPTPNLCNEFASIGGRNWKVITGERSSIISRPNTFRGYIFNYFRKFADTQVCNSENARQKWAEVSPKYASKLRTIYNAVNIGEVTSDYQTKLNGKFHVVIIASIYGIKNPMGLLEAVKLMTKEERYSIIVDWYGNPYNTIGDDVEYRQLIEVIRDNHLEDVIRTHPATNDVVNIINRADCVALLSCLEGLPNAICEGMVVGKPIIMTRVSDYDVLVDESNGILCDWDSPESIKNAFVCMSKKDAEQLKKMGAASKEKAELYFTPKVITEQWIKIINEK